MLNVWTNLLYFWHLSFLLNERQAWTITNNLSKRIVNSNASSQMPKPKACIQMCSSHLHHDKIFWPMFSVHTWTRVSPYKWLLPSLYTCATVPVSRPCSGSCSAAAATAAVVAALALAVPADLTNQNHHHHCNLSSNPIGQSLLWVLLVSSLRGPVANAVHHKLSWETCPRIKYHYHTWHLRFSKK